MSRFAGLGFLILLSRILQQYINDRKHIVFEFLVEISVWDVLQIGCLYLYTELEGKIPDRFPPNSQQTNQLGQYECTRRVFENFVNQFHFLAKTFKNRFLLSAVTIKIQVRNCLQRYRQHLFNHLVSLSKQQYGLYIYTINMFRLLFYFLKKAIWYKQSMQVEKNYFRIKQEYPFRDPLSSKRVFLMSVCNLYPQPFPQNKVSEKACFSSWYCLFTLGQLIKNYQLNIFPLKGVSKR